MLNYPPMPLTERQRILNRECTKRWRANHPERARESTKKWWAKNKERMRLWRLDNLEHIRAKIKECHARQRAKNPEEYKKRATLAAKLYREKHPRSEAQRKANCERIKSDYAKNRERILANLKAIRIKNKKPRKIVTPEQRRARKLAWTIAHRKKNPEKYREYVRTRRIQKARLIGSHTLAQWLARVAFYGWRCAYCGKTLSQKTLTKDHVMPIARGGTDFASNTVPACGHCNSSKGRKKQVPKLYPVSAIGCTSAATRTASA
jgi:5-methylcytosine-specific restriction endonuclease McrA